MCSFKHRKILSYDIDFLLNINMKYCTVVSISNVLIGRG